MPQASLYTPSFTEAEVDWGSDDDRTAEEKAEDEALLEATKQRMQAFLQAPPELRKALRTTLEKMPGTS